MDVYGMVSPYPVNRVLTVDEKENQLKQQAPQHQDPHYNLSLLKINSTFAESVDKFYQLRGGLAMRATVVAIFGAVVSILFVKTMLDSFDPSDWTVWLVIIFPPIIYMAYWFFRKDAFTYTHYPIRFNRHNRTVYVWQRDGSVLKAAWDDLFFTTISTGMLQLSSIVGHVLAEDGKTVTDTFSFSYNGSREQLQAHFEFYRRYMEESPQRAFEQSEQSLPLYCLPPLDKEKETFKFGWARTTAQMNGWPLMQLLFQVFFLPESLMRWVVMQTSKIPKWPQWVEEECAIETDDPFVKDHSTNTTDLYGNPLDNQAK